MNVSLTFQGGFVISTTVMIDSGATGVFCDWQFARHHHIPLVCKLIPEAVRSVDGSQLSSGPITHQTIQGKLVSLEIHQEEIQFDLIDAPLYGNIFRATLASKT